MSCHSFLMLRYGLPSVWGSDCAWISSEKCYPQSLGLRPVKVGQMEVYSIEGYGHILYIGALSKISDWNKNKKCFLLRACVCKCLNTQLYACTKARTKRGFNWRMWANCKLAYEASSSIHESDLLYINLVILFNNYLVKGRGGHFSFKSLCAICVWKNSDQAGSKCTRGRVYIDKSGLRERQRLEYNHNEKWKGGEQQGSKSEAFKMISRRRISSTVIVKQETPAQLARLLCAESTDVSIDFRVLSL